MKSLQISPRASLSTQVQPKSPRVPASARIREQLRRRGVPLVAPVDGANDLFEARIETALMALFRDHRGEEEFTALYDYSADGLQVQVARQLAGQGGRLDPKEICQDVFVNVYRYSAGFRDEAPRSFRSWSGAIARNAIRRRFVRRPAFYYQALPEGVAEPVDPRRGPVAQLSVLEERTRIAGAWGILLTQYLAAFQKLSKRDQIALQMIEVEGLSYSEGCERLGVGMSNMKMIMFRARKRIRLHIATSLACALGTDATERMVG